MSTSAITPANPSTYLQQLLDGVSAVAPTSSSATAAAAGSTTTASPSATSVATTATSSTSALVTPDPGLASGRPGTSGSGKAPGDASGHHHGGGGGGGGGSSSSSSAGTTTETVMINGVPTLVTIDSATGATVSTTPEEQAYAATKPTNTGAVVRRPGRALRIISLGGVCGRRIVHLSVNYRA